MSPFEWILVVDAVALVAVAIGCGSGMADTRATRAWRPVTDTDWALWQSCLADEASSLHDVTYLNGRARTLGAKPRLPRRPPDRR
jgi:hypothetical protein